MQWRGILSVIGFASLALFAAACSAAEAVEQQESSIGDMRTGSRAIPVHLIPLLDEEGQELYADDEPPLPFSVRQTCASRCHTYERIESGWHFNAHRQASSAGRPGHPWILVDHATRTLLPLSYRAWAGVFHPHDAGLSDWDFVKRFGRHMPGGGVGQWDTAEDPEKIAVDLERLLPREQWVRFSMRTILHGRRACTARRPRCERCVLDPVCPRLGVSA